MKKAIKKLVFVIRIGFKPMTFPTKVGMLYSAELFGKRKSELQARFCDPDWIQTNDLPD